MDLFGILLGLALLIWLAFRGWPRRGPARGRGRGEAPLDHWTQTFMAARSWRSSFFWSVLGALFGKLMEDSGAVLAIATATTTCLGPRRAVLAVVAHALFRAADIAQRLVPAAIALGTSPFTLSALSGTQAVQNATQCRSSASLPLPHRAYSLSPLKHPSPKRAR
jgi:hypothetical protein